MIRALTIIAAIAALAVTAAPVASAGTSKAKAPRAEQATAFVWLAELSPVKADDSMFHGTGGDGEKFAKAPAAMRLTAITDGTSNTLQFVTATPQPVGSNGIIAILIGL